MALLEVFVRVKHFDHLVDHIGQGRLIETAAEREALFRLKERKRRNLCTTILLWELVLRVVCLHIV
jgi:hypothetical protein